MPAWTHNYHAAEIRRIYFERLGCEAMKLEEVPAAGSYIYNTAAWLEAADIPAERVLREYGHAADTLIKLARLQQKINTALALTGTMQRHLER